MSAVAPELRTPRMFVTSIPMNAVTLPVIRTIMSLKSSPGQGVALTEHRVGDEGIDVVVLTPTEGAEPRPAVLSLHGGGMCAGTAQLETQPAGRLARELGAVVVLPNYRLAPENPFPAGLDDAMDTLQWMVKSAHELGIDPGRIAVCGTSAGGGLAAAVAQRAFDAGILAAGPGARLRRCSTIGPSARRSRRSRRADVVAEIQPMGLDRLPGSRAAAVDSLPNTRRPRGAPTWPGWRRRGSVSASWKSVLRRECRIRRDAARGRCAMRTRHRAGDVPHRRRSAPGRAVDARLSRQHGGLPARSTGSGGVERRQLTGDIGPVGV